MPETSIKKKFILPRIFINLLISLVVSLIVVGAFWFLTGGYKAKTIAVQGNSSSFVVNEISTYSLSIEESDPDKQEAVKKISEKSADVVKIIKDFGIEDKDVQTTNLNIYQKQNPVYRDGVTDYELGDWVASYTINATLRDLEKSPDFTALLASVESASMWGPNLTIDNSTVDEESLLSSAIDDAKAKAESIASKLGRKLGKVIQISEGAVPTSSYNGVYRLEGMGGGGIGIEPGATQTYKSVVVVYELR